MTRNLVAAASGIILMACGGSGGAPTAPPPPPPPPAAETRIIRLEANLDFGDVRVGDTVERDLRIYNSGTAPLTVTGITGPGAGTAFSANWTAGTIAAGDSQLSVIRFSPPQTQTWDGTLTVQANHTSGTNTIAIRGRGIQVGPRTQFGAGQHLVGTSIAPGRYFSDPVANCYWERQSGLGGTLGEIIANEFISYNAAQWIVDILPSDRAFETDSECGTWFNTPRHGAQSSIRPGVWLVGQQVAPGTYRTNSSGNCYWARLRNFEGTIGSIIANDFSTDAGTRHIDIRQGDAGFQANANCGTWMQATGTSTAEASVAEPSLGEIEYHWRRHREAQDRQRE